MARPKTWKGRVVPRVSESEFRQWYEHDGLTTYEIADKCGVSRKSVFRWMLKWGIEAIPRKRVFEHLKRWSLTDRQKELIVGTMLGDGCIGRHGSHSRLHIAHCEAQKGLVDWLWREFQPLAVTPPGKNMDRRGNSVMWCFTTLTHPGFDPYDLLFYDQERLRPDGSRIKVVRPEIEDLLTPLSLAVWFMDDGSSSEHKYVARFSTEGFTKEETARIVESVEPVEPEKPVASSPPCCPAQICPVPKSVKVDWSEADKEIWREDYNGGMTIRQISEKRGATRCAVRKALKDRVEWHRKYADKLDASVVLGKFDNGSSIRSIAKEFGISAPAISRLLRKHGRKTTR
jgi:transposase